MPFNKPPQKINPKETLSNYVREIRHHSPAVTLEMATILTLIGMLGAAGIWILGNQVSLEKRLTTLETQYQASQQGLQEIKEKISKLTDKLDVFLQREIEK